MDLGFRVKDLGFRVKDLGFKQVEEPKQTNPTTLTLKPNSTPTTPKSQIPIPTYTSKHGALQRGPL